MRRKLAFDGAAGPRGRMITSIACLAFVGFLTVAFWAGVMWIAQAFMTLGSQGF